MTKNHPVLDEELSKPMTRQYRRELRAAERAPAPQEKPRTPRLAPYNRRERHVFTPLTYGDTQDD